MATDVYFVFGSYIDEFVRDAAVKLFGYDSERAANELEQMGFTVFPSERRKPRLRGFFGYAEYPDEVSPGSDAAYDLMPSCLPQFRNCDRILNVRRLYQSLPPQLRDAMSNPRPILVVDERE